MSIDEKHVRDAEADVSKKEKRPWLRAALSGIVIAALTVSMLGYLTRLVEGKYSYVKNESFYAQDEDFDVLFFGTSHTIEGIFPMELWKDYGIVSYNLGHNTAAIPMSYWILKNALDHTSPKLAVLDCYALSSDVMGAAGSELFHCIVDSMPFTMTTLKAIQDTRPSDTPPLEFYWNFALYHTRWNELTSNDFMPELLREKGAESYRNVEYLGMDLPPLIDSSIMFEGETNGVIYLRKFIEECQNAGIEVLLTFCPCGYAEDEATQKDANRAAQIAEEYGIEFLNFIHTDVINATIDTRDMSHLNPSGGRKLTDYLGKYIMEHYDIPDRRDDPDYAGWYNDYEVYKQDKIQSLSNSANGHPYEWYLNYPVDLKNYLMLLYDKHFSSCIYLTDNMLWHGDGLYDKLLANIGIDSNTLYTGEPTLAIVDNANGGVVYLPIGGYADTSFGHVSLEWTETGALSICINGVSCLDVAGNAAASVAVIDNDTGQVVTTSQFEAATATTVNKIA